MMSQSQIELIKNVLGKYSHIYKCDSVIEHVIDFVNDVMEITGKSFNEILNTIAKAEENLKLSKTCCGSGKAELNEKYTINVVVTYTNYCNCHGIFKAVYLELRENGKLILEKKIWCG